MEIKFRRFRINRTKFPKTYLQEAPSNWKVSSLDKGNNNDHQSVMKVADKMISVITSFSGKALIKSLVKSPAPLIKVNQKKFRKPKLIHNIKYDVKDKWKLED